MDPWEKSETVDPEVRAYVYSLVNAVGGSSTLDSTYAVGDDAIAVLKDLVRWLKLYDEKTGRMDVKRCLAEANLVKGDLLEILALWPEEATHNKARERLALACLELLVPLTWPLELDIEKATVNHHRHVPYLQLAQVGYKRAVLHHEYAKILRTVLRVVLPAIAQPRRDRTPREESMIKLGLYFFRNIAMIAQPQHLPSQGDENDINRPATIEAFHQQDVFRLLLTLGSGMGDEFKEQDVIVLEILFHLLKGVDPKKLYMNKEERSNAENDELKALISKEKAMLSSYNKHAPTRHNRFGTMIWVKRDEMKYSTVSGQTSITDETSTLHRMDASKKWNRPRGRGRQTQEVSEQADIGAKVDLTESARKQLMQFVDDFLDSSFNPLFSSLRQAIGSEAYRVQETMHNKQFFYLVSWFLSAEAARREHAQRRTQTQSVSDPATPEDNTFAYIAAVLDQETFVLLNRKMQSALDNKEWQDLQATLLCFTQILLTVQKMAESKDEEDQEIAENIQNRIFYEETTHDRMVQILRGYTRQGFAYLDAVTECVHVFVRMLEKYSKQNADLQIRSKRRARKKQKEQARRSGESNIEGGDNDIDAEERAQDEQEAHQTVSERKFDFARFSAKFLSQGCVDTFVALMHYYADLSSAQLKRCHRYLYRLAFKQDLAVFLFRVDILQLLHKMIKGPGGLDPACEGFKEWEQLVQQIFRRCFKWLERETEGQGWKEAMVVEMLFSKIPSTVYYLQNGYERVVEKRAPRPPAELVIKAGVAEEMRVAVATSILIEQAKTDALDWIKKQLTLAADERKAWEDSQSARPPVVDPETGEEQAAAEKIDPPSIFLVADNEERKEALFKDKHLRLLLTTLGLQRLGLPEDTDASWVIPGELSSAQLQKSVDEIQKTEFDPPVFEGEKRAMDLIRLKSASRKGATFSDDEDDEGVDGDGLDDAMFPPNLREKRKKRGDDGVERPAKRRKRNAVEFTEEELDERARKRRLKEKEKNAKIKSKLFVTESDDESDEERDQQFYKLEEERRKKTAGMIRSALLKQMDQDEDEDGESGNKGRKGKKAKAVKKTKAKKSKSAGSENEDEAEDEDESMHDISSDDDDAASSPAAAAIASSRPKRSAAKSGPFIVSDDDEDEDSDVSMDSSIAGISANTRRRAVENDEDDDDDEDEEGTPSTSPPASTTALHKAGTSPLKEVSGNSVAQIHDEDEDEDDDPVPAKRTSLATARRNVRAGFVLDDSDDE